MALTYSFVDNGIYGTNDINSIAQRLTGTGIMPFAARDTYNVSDLNALTYALVETGIQLDGCVCSAENTGTAEMTVTVAKGIVFFESGVSLTVDEEGYIVAIASNQKGYIYAYYSPSLQKADIVFETDLPADNEYVLLAEVSENGSLTDRRNFARSKVATMGSNAEYSIEESRITVYETYAKAPAYSGREKIIAEIDLSGIDITKFNYLIYRYDYSASGSTAPEYQEKYFNFKNSERESFYIKGSLHYYSSMFDIVLEGTKFVIVIGNETTFSSYKGTFESAMPYFKLV